MSERVQHDGFTVEINSSCPPATAAFIREQPAKLAAEKAAWIAELRRRGVKAAHPDDGWVDRREYTVHLEYPYFNDGLSVGDLLALGSPPTGALVVRVKATIAPGPLVAPLLADGAVWAYAFEALTEPWPPLAATKPIPKGKR